MAFIYNRKTLFYFNLHDIYLELVIYNVAPIITYILIQNSIFIIQCIIKYHNTIFQSKKTIIILYIWLLFTTYQVYL
jgi:hypothetical protein